MENATVETRTLTRKERVVAERHNLFLSIARQMMHKEGFHQLSMDRVAENAEYSKGTIYQHFPNKEEILIQLCNRSMSSLRALGQRAVDYPGNHRERCLAFQFAHDIWQNLEPEDVCMMHNLHTDGLMDKVSAKSRDIHDQLEQSIIGRLPALFRMPKMRETFPTALLTRRNMSLDCGHFATAGNCFAPMIFLSTVLVSVIQAGQLLLLLKLHLTALDGSR